MVDTESTDLEAVKDEAWSKFDGLKSGSLEQENFTKVEVLNDEESEEEG